MADRRKVSDKQLRSLEPYVESGPSPQGEYRLRCPMHGERHASASVNLERGWYCNVCETGGTVRDLIKFIEELPDDDPRKRKSSSSNVYDLGEERRRRRSDEGPPDEVLSESRVLGWHNDLMDSPELLRPFRSKRGLNKATLREFRIGYDSRSKVQRYTIPVYDELGRLVNVRRYRLDHGASQKVWNARGHGNPPRLYPLHVIEGVDEVVLCEGELDALLTTQKGFPAVTGTGGAKKWVPAWAEHFKGKTVFVCYDNDEDGRTGAKRAAKHLAKVAAAVHVLPALGDAKGYDLTDWWLEGHSASDFRSLLDSLRSEPDDPAEEEPAGEELVDVRVIGSMDSRTNGQPLRMAVTVVGRKDPTYSIPSTVRLDCTMDAGQKCKTCPMLDEGGDAVLRIDSRDTSIISQFIDARRSSTQEVLRGLAGIPKCNRLEMEEKEALTAEELFVMSSVDGTSHEAVDYTARRIYNVGGDGSTLTNTEVRVHGTTVPSPKDRRNEFFSWELEEATTSLDSFEVTDDVVAALKQFQPAKGQEPLEKMREIAEDLSANVTFIHGRERMHMAMDLVWHSQLRFKFDRSVLQRGWLELLVVGDTRTGKSETALRLQDHYGLGHVIGCEGATFAGLVGGVKEVGTSRTITWGEITVNDRRLVVLDEASGLSQEIISQLSDIRSRGVAQITKIETAMTNARCRAIWISNPRQSRYGDDGVQDGIHMVEGLIGNPEDIARFDFAMSVSEHDVPTEKINRMHRGSTGQVYTSDLCRTGVLWAWSRRPDDVVWDTGAMQHVLNVANKLGRMYINQPPLVQGASVRIKVARMAVALAARLFSTDETGTKVVVRKEHVRDAARFLNTLYSYDNFGYRRVSRRAIRNKELARKNRAQIKDWLRRNPRLLEFLLDRKASFRSQDLEEMAHLHREEIGDVLGKLSDAKMVTKSKSQIVIEPELKALLKQIEDERYARRK